MTGGGEHAIGTACDRNDGEGGKRELGGNDPSEIGGHGCAAAIGDGGGDVEGAGAGGSAADEAGEWVHGQSRRQSGGVEGEGVLVDVAGLKRESDGLADEAGLSCWLREYRRGGRRSRVGGEGPGEHLVGVGLTSGRSGETDPGGGTEQGGQVEIGTCDDSGGGAGGDIALGQENTKGIGGAVVVDPEGV